MRAMNASRLAILSCLSLSASCSQEDRSFERPGERHIYSRVARGGEGEVMVAATFSGGGAGDTTFRLLACPKDKPECEELAAVSVANEDRKPDVRAASVGIEFVVEQNDRIGFFRSFSRSIPSLSEGPIYLRYRSDPAPSPAAK